MNNENTKQKGVSIITCSIKPEQCDRMLNSIKNTIGVEFETIIFNNSEKEWGICKVYNYCAEQAKYPYLCFIHEDVLIGSNGWGKSMVDFMDAESSCGVMGFAGTKQVARNFINWSFSDFLLRRYNFSDPEGRQNCLDINDLINCNYNPDGEIFSEVIILDGFFLMVKKEVWQQNRFDSKTFDGFHFYDSDFTISVAKNYKNYVYQNANICHFSSGTMNKVFCNNMFLFHKKWKHELPFSLKHQNYIQKTNREIDNIIDICKICVNNGFALKDILPKIIATNSLFIIVIILLYPIRLCKKILKKVIMAYCTKTRLIKAAIKKAINFS